MPGLPNAVVADAVPSIIATCPITSGPERKVTLPVGLPCPETVAVNVTDANGADLGALEVRVIVVVNRLGPPPPLLPPPQPNSPIRQTTANQRVERLGHFLPGQERITIDSPASSPPIAIGLFSATNLRSERFRVTLADLTA